MPSLKQRSFSGGIISPEVFGNDNQAKYANGVQQALNVTIPRFGSAQSRAGTVYLDRVDIQHSPAWNNTQAYAVNQTVVFGDTWICLAANTNQEPDVSPTYWTPVLTYPVREAKFVVNFSAAYLLVFSVNNIRIYKNGVQVAIPLADVTAWSAGTYQLGAVRSYSGTVYISAVPNAASAPGVTPGEWFPMVANTAGDYLLDIPINSSSITIPPAALPVLQAYNYNDVMYVTSNYSAPFKMVRTNDETWEITPFFAETDVPAPGSVHVTNGTAPGATSNPPTGLTAIGGNGSLPKNNYKVTAINASGESLPTAFALSTVGGADAGHHVALSWTAPAGSPTNYYVYRIGTGGLWLIAVTVATNYSDDGSITSAATAKAPPVVQVGGIDYVYGVTSLSADDGTESEVSTTTTVFAGVPTSDNPNVVTWVAPAGVDPAKIKGYNIYRYVNGVPGFIGTTPNLFFNDINIQPDFATQPPVMLTDVGGAPLFSTSSQYWPAVISYFQQRLCFAATLSQPTTVWMSRTGAFDNFTVNTPTQDSAAIEFVVAGKQAQPIIALMDLQKLIIHTAAAEYSCLGNQAGTITPTAISITQQGSAGTALPAPVVIGNTTLFVQARGAQLRDLRFSIQSYTYQSRDLTIYSTGLFNDVTIVDMDWQQIKDSTVWCAINDGKLYGNTYIPEHDIWAWHQHTTDGTVKNVCVVPETGEDVLYPIVQRTNGLFLEKLAQRDYVDEVYYSDFIGCDCSLTYNGTFVGAAPQTSTSGGWAVDDLITITINNATEDSFVPDDVINQNQVVITQYDNEGQATGRISFLITEFADAQTVRGYPLGTVPIWAQGSTDNSVGKAVKHFSNLTQLANQNISVFADGNVVASPNAVDPNGNALYSTITVAGDGTFIIPSPALVVTAGLPFTADFQTLPVENSQGETIQNKHIAVKACTPIFFKSRDGYYGQDFEHLQAWKQPRGPNPVGFIWGQPVEPFTGPFNIPIKGTPQTTGQVCVRVYDPVPFAISGLITTFELGDC